MLSDGDQIRNLLGTYAERMDLADHAGVGELFGEDGLLATEDGTVLARGSSAIASFFAGMVKLHDGQQRTKHLVANTVLVPDGADAVVARSSYVVFQGTDELPLQPIMAGRYVDRFHRAAEGWTWVERRYIADLVGHLSQHLRQL
jgi:hypothetical protein